MPKKKNIFISHITEEAETALILQKEIEAVFGNKISTFVSSDEKTLRLGEFLLSHIEKGLKKADLLITLCSKESVVRPWINIELGAGWIQGIPVIPVCHRDMKIEDLPFQLLARRAIQASELKDLGLLYKNILNLLGETNNVPDAGSLYEKLLKLERNRKKKIKPDIETFKVANSKNLFSTLSEMLEECRISSLKLKNSRKPESKREGAAVWAVHRADAKDWVSEQFKKSSKEICIICYSFIYYKDNFHSEIKEFLNKTQAKLRILMLSPDSDGFREKTALEAFTFGEPPCESEWIKDLSSTMDNHRDDIKNCVTHLKGWRSKFGKDKVEYGYYTDTPNFYGLLFDRSALGFSSYFLNPFLRGFENPMLLVDNCSKDPNLKLLKKLFLNWFEVKIAFSKKY